jgi:predicted RNA binding protein YcfA (HicA-like mRNA interferase family)
MKIQRDLSGDDLAKAPRKVGYEITRQTGGHLRVTTNQQGQHHVTIPNHNPIKVGTLAGILGDAAGYFKFSREELLHRLFG